jgi:hypothetical protein
MVVATLFLILSPCLAATLVEDDFEGAELDLAKWQALNGPDVSIVQANGQVFFNRPATPPNSTTQPSHH